MDTEITKGRNGFGLTLAEVVTFIPSKLLGLRFPSGTSPNTMGFYQRLLQIRAVTSSSLPGSPHDRDNGHPGSVNRSVRPGDMLLAVEGFRLAGCTPEYAVRLLAGVPVGGAVHVTLLRGLALAPMQVLQNVETFHANERVEKCTVQKTGQKCDQPEENKRKTGSPLIQSLTVEKPPEEKQPFKNVSLGIDLVDENDKPGWQSI